MIQIRPGKLDYLFLIHKNLDFHVGGRSFFIIHYLRKHSKSSCLLLSKPKQPSCKKKSAAPKKATKLTKFALPPPLGFGTKFTGIVVIKIFAINLPSQPFLGRHLGFHIFFHFGLFGGCTLFLQLGCFGLHITSFCIVSHKTDHMALMLPFNLFFFLYCRNCGTKECV